MTTYKLGQRAPQLSDDVWIASSVQVISRVTLGKHSSVWFNAVLRADNELVQIGDESNIQDGAVLHSDPGFPLVIGQSVTVGHQVMLHGCIIGGSSSIGIGAIVLNGARIGHNCIVSAGALITAGREFPDGSLIVGSLAEAKRPLSEERLELLEKSSRNYLSNANRFAMELSEVNSCS